MIYYFTRLKTRRRINSREVSVMIRMYACHWVTQTTDSVYIDNMNGLDDTEKTGKEEEGSWPNNDDARSHNDTEEEQDEDDEFIMQIVQERAA